MKLVVELPGEGHPTDPKLSIKPRTLEAEGDIDKLMKVAEEWIETEMGEKFLYSVLTLRSTLGLAQEFPDSQLVEEYYRSWDGVEIRLLRDERPRPWHIPYVEPS